MEEMPLEGPPDPGSVSPPVELCTKRYCIDWGTHTHDATGRILFPCSWHPGEFHNICSEACN